MRAACPCYRYTSIMMWVCTDDCTSASFKHSLHRLQPMGYSTNKKRKQNKHNYLHKNFWFMFQRKVEVIRGTGGTSHV